MDRKNTVPTLKELTLTEGDEPSGQESVQLPYIVFFHCEQEFTEKTGVFFLVIQI